MNIEITQRTKSDLAFLERMLMFGRDIMSMSVEDIIDTHLTEFGIDPYAMREHLKNHGYEDRFKEWMQSREDLKDDG